MNNRENFEVLLQQMTRQNGYSLLNKRSNLKIQVIIFRLENYSRHFVTGRQGST